MHSEAAIVCKWKQYVLPYAKAPGCCQISLAEEQVLV